MSVQFLIPNLSIAEDTQAPRTYRVPEQCSQWVNYVEKYDWDTTMVIKIMVKESGCNPNAINYTDSHKGCSGSYNLMQVGCLHYKKGEVKNDPSLNLKIAYDIYLKAGRKFSRDWTTCKLVKGCV